MSIRPEMAAFDGGNVFDRVPELPDPGNRWTAARKAVIVGAIRGNWVPIEEVCEVYDLSPDEVLAWERDIDRYGVPGLRATRLQIYRDTDRARQQR